MFYKIIIEPVNKPVLRTSTVTIGDGPTDIEVLESIEQVGVKITIIGLSEVCLKSLNHFVKGIERIEEDFLQMRRLSELYNVSIPGESDAYGIYEDTQAVIDTDIITEPAEFFVEVGNQSESIVGICEDNRLLLKPYFHQSGYNRHLNIGISIPNTCGIDMELLGALNAYFSAKRD